jgi:hypothetical protein
MHHRLVPSCGSGSVVDMARDLVALHATDPTAVHLAASETHSLTTWPGPARVAPLFATPLERDLVGAP